MIFPRLIASASVFLFCTCLTADAHELSFRLATKAEGRTVLAASDTFVQTLSLFDRSARLKSGKPVSQADYLSFVADQAQDFEPGQRETLSQACQSLNAKLAALDLPPLDEILIVKTSGLEEGGAPYTRGSAIILPNQTLNASALEKILTHELFHVLSRKHPELRDRLYALAGFQPCPPLKFPAELQSRKISNPDAPELDHWIQLGSRHYIPILVAKSAYNEVQGGEFFQYMTLQLLAVGADGQPLRQADRSLNLLAPNTEYRKKTGGNTGYVIHPEEVLADNFVLLIQGGKAASPALLDGLRSILAEASK